MFTYLQEVSDFAISNKDKTQQHSLREHKQNGFLATRWTSGAEYKFFENEHHYTKGTFTGCTLPQFPLLNSRAVHI